MNLERLNQVVDAYVKNFDMLNGDCDENMKWRASYHFKKHFDPNASNFYEMFKEAMSASDIIINNGTVQPVNGILKLISHEEDTMRELFAKLFAEDGGDLDQRESRIEYFVEEANKLLEKYERGKWKYKQDFRSVLAYLAFYKPEENYLYKAGQCQPFFRYLEFGEEIGSGQYFKLSRYYNMCDRVRQALIENEALMEKHKERWSKVGDPEDDFHILTFDIIYCSIVYNFYAYENYTRMARKSKSEQERERLLAQIEKKRFEISELEASLDEARKKLDAIPEVEICGLTVKNKFLGVGKVVKQSGTYITVQFPTKESRFILSRAFIDGFLTAEDESIFERCHSLESALADCDDIEREIKSKQSELELLFEKQK